MHPCVAHVSTSLVVGLLYEVFPEGALPIRISVETWLMPKEKSILFPFFPMKLEEHVLM